MLGLDYVTAFHNILPPALRLLKHLPQINIAKPAILHALDEMGAELKFPCPPFRPLWAVQNLPPVIRPAKSLAPSLLDNVGDKRRAGPARRLREQAT